MNPIDFVNKWRHTTLRERQACQQHFLDVCDLIGHAKPAELDPYGTFFCFEAGATKWGGEDGFADVWYKGHFAWEYKGKHANLDKAYQQLLQYRDSPELENPPLLVVSDIEKIIVYTNFTNTPRRTYVIDFDRLQTPDGLEILRNVFNNPDALRAPETTEQVTERAATQFAHLAELLRNAGHQPHEIAHFLIRLLFCLFAEDVDLLPSNLFSNLVRNLRNRHQIFAAQLGLLFSTMATGGAFGSEEIPHFDGHLFNDSNVLPLDSDELEILNRVSRLDWSGIEPSIFGTLFERSLDPSKRAQLGAHYTSKDDILLIIEPVLMTPLRRSWAEVQDQARELAARRDEAKGGQRTRLANQLTQLLTGFAQEIAEMQVLDPACGSGNFLYVALRQLLDLQKEVIQLAAILDVGYFAPSVSPVQLHGIEINEYAHQLAQATIWIGFIQWYRENGFGYPSEPILKPLDNILNMDAILTYDEQGNPCVPEWPQADVIIGNPPFLGDKKMRGELGDRYVDELRTFYQGRVSGGADLVTYWFEHAFTQIMAGHAKRAGLLATNSIRQQGNRFILEKIKETGDLFMAWSDRPWIQDGAAVRVSMVGFDNGTEQERYLDGNKVTRINSDLTSNVDVTIALQLAENEGVCFLGMMKAGPFDIDGGKARELLSAPLNPNGRSNSDVVKKRMSGTDVTSRPRDIWLIDFGTNMSEEDASLYERPFEYVKLYVKPIRDVN